MVKYIDSPKSVYTYTLPLEVMLISAVTYVKSEVIIKSSH
jgi:hypothetical protein